MNQIRRIRLFAAALLLGLLIPLPASAVLTDADPSPDALPNGIVIPDDWRFRVDPDEGDPVTPPYLIPADQGGYAPETVNIDVGRQLFADDFLISSTTLTRTWHQAKLLDEPIFRAETEWELTEPASAAMVSGGLWYDMDEKLYKMWYEAGFNNRMAYATSQDGIHWERPALNADGSNLIVRGQQSDSSSVWIDYNAPAEERYKMMLRNPNTASETMLPARLYTSSNGTVWKPAGVTGTLGDRSTFFYNPFTGTWVFSCRYQYRDGLAWGPYKQSQRSRFYHAGLTFAEAAQWDWDSSNRPVLWLKTDSADQIDRTQPGNRIPEVYNFDSIAYESVMLGMFQIWYGPTNATIAQTKKPKITELQAAFSRDGFYYDRPCREALIPASRTEGTWDYGYLQSATGGLIVYDDEIRIYYSALSGRATGADGSEQIGPYVGGAVGYATLRRDGFSSMDGTGTLLTTPLTVTKQVRYLFINADTSAGSLRAEILDADGNVLEGCSADRCRAMTADDCCYALSWDGAEDLSFLTGKRFRIRFTMENGELYAFWLSADPAGASGGAVGAGYAGEKNLNPDPTPGTETGTDSGIDSGTDAAPAPTARGCRSALTALPAVLPALLPGLFLPLLLRTRNKKGSHPHA